MEIFVHLGELGEFLNQSEVLVGISGDKVLQGDEKVQDSEKKKKIICFNAMCIFL